jgi:ketosteroid isomerase-like protein
MKCLVLALTCLPLGAAWGGPGSDEPRGAPQAESTRIAGLRALFAADALHTAQIGKLGPVEGIAGSLLGDALYLGDGIGIVQGKEDIRAALRAANPDAAPTTLKRALAGGDASADGRFGFTFGWLERSSAGAATAYGTYVSTWARPDASGPFRVTAYYTRASQAPRSPIREGFPLLAGGTGAGGVPHPDGLEAQRRSLLSADGAFAALSVEQDLSRAFSTYAAGLVMPFGRDFSFLLGKQEVVDFYRSKPGQVLSWTPLFAGSSESGDLGFTVGTAVDTVPHPDGKVERFPSKYLTLWARQADGTWRFVADGGSATPGPSP